MCTLNPQPSSLTSPEENGFRMVVWFLDHVLPSQVDLRFATGEEAMDYFAENHKGRMCSLMILNPQGKVIMSVEEANIKKLP